MPVLPKDPAPTREFRAVWPPRLVWVYERGQWRKAQLEGFSRTRLGCFALVRPNPRIHTQPGERHWVPAYRVRTRDQLPGALRTSVCTDPE